MTDDPRKNMKSWLADSSDDDEVNRWLHGSGRPLFAVIAVLVFVSAVVRILW